MTSRDIGLALVIGVACLSGRLVAQPAAPPPLTLSLEEAIARASTTSNVIAESRARSDGAAAVVGQRHAPMQPQVVGLAGYTRTNHIVLPPGILSTIYPDLPDNLRTRLDVQWPIYTFGRLDALESAARFDQHAAERDVDTTAMDIRLEVTRAFWGVIVAAEAQRVVDQSLAQIGQHVREIRNQRDAGLVAPSDVLTAEAQEARERVLSIQARMAREVAETDLARRIGVDPATPIVPVATLEPPTIEASFDALVADARQNRPDRQALEQRIAAAGQRHDAAAAGRRPTIAVGAGVDYARPNPKIFPRAGYWQDSWDASVNISWPLLDGGKTKYETAEVAATVRMLRSRLAELDSVMALDIRQRLSELESSRAALEAADVGVRAATEARRVVGERFAAGVAASIDVVDAQVAILQAELDRVQAIASARLAEARLKRALGQ